MEIQELMINYENAKTDLEEKINQFYHVKLTKAMSLLNEIDSFFLNFPYGDENEKGSLMDTLLTIRTVLEDLDQKKHLNINYPKQGGKG